MDPTPGPGEQLQAMLEEIRRAELSLADLTRRREAARQDLSEAERQEAAAEQALASERADVADLERLSVARIRAALRGSRDTDLDREQAEAQRAEYALGLARHESAARRERLADLDSRIAADQAVLRMRPEVEAARERWLREASPGIAGALDEVAGRASAVDAEIRELDEALAAGQQAAAALSAAAGELGSARGWSTYDTFFGGGMISSAIKHDRIDRATATLRGADEALRRLGLELRDVGMTDLRGLDIPEMRRMFDIWFDNIFSDLGVRQAILRASDQVDAVRHRVGIVVTELEGRRESAAGRRATIDRERSALLERGA